MNIEQRLYQLLSPVVDQLFPISAPLGTAPPYTVYRFIGSEPWTTQDGTVTDLRKHHMDFISFGLPGEQYGLISGRTQSIMDVLLPFHDPSIQSVTLVNRQTHYDTHYKLDANIAEFEIIESVA